MSDAEAPVLSTRKNARGDVRVWCPRARDLASSAASSASQPAGHASESNHGDVADDTYADRLRHFQWHWSRGHPVVVRDVPAGISWAPAVVERAMSPLDVGRRQNGGSRSDRMVPVVNCAADVGPGGDAKAEVMTPRDFFKGFTDASVFSAAATNESTLYALKDWPSEAEFRDWMPAHYSHFIAGLPFPEYTNPRDGPLNLATHAPKAPRGAGAGLELGPRSNIAYGRREERGPGDSVVRLHVRARDEVDALMYAHDAAGGGPDADDASRAGEYGGASWQIFRREDAPAVCAFLLARRRQLAHAPPEAAVVRHPIHDGLFFLTGAELDALAEETNGEVAPWSFEQNEHDAVLVPAACPRQVRHLKSCVRVAMHFASPETLPAAMAASDEIRALPRGTRGRAEEGHTHVALLHAVHAAVHKLRSLRPTL